MIRRLIVTAAVASLALAAVAPVADAASTSTRLTRLERSMRAQQRTTATLSAQLAATRQQLAATTTRLAAAETKLAGTDYLLRHCLQARSFTTAATGTGLYVPNFNHTSAAPFYMATLLPSCVGVIAPRWDMNGPQP